MSTDSMSTDASGMSARLQQIRESEDTLPIRPPQQRSALVAALERASVPERVVVPMPRRGRMFLRHPEGHGSFSDVTLTSPVRTGEDAPA